MEAPGQLPGPRIGDAADGVAGMRHLRQLRWSPTLEAGVPSDEFVGEILAFHPEQHAPVLLDDPLQMLDLLCVSALLSDQQRLQGLLVERVRSASATSSICTVGFAPFIWLPDSNPDSLG